MKFDNLIKQAKQEGAVILDVRTPQEYKQGHVPGSINTPLDRLTGEKLDKSKKFFVYCHSGARSANACKILTKNGYNAVNIGGILSYKGELE